MGSVSRMTILIGKQDCYDRKEHVTAIACNPLQILHPRYLILVEKKKNMFWLSYQDVYNNELT